MPKVGKMFRSERKPRAAKAPASLARALFSSTQQRVLALLFGQPERSFFTTELIDLTKAGSGSVQRELKRLAEAGLVRVTRIGNQKHYQADPTTPIYGELCSLVAKTLGPAETIRRALTPFEDRLRLALLYGSVARHSDTAHSDIDVLIVSDELTLESVLEALAAAEQRLGRAVNPTVYRTDEFERRRASGNAFLERVLTGEHIILMGAEDDLISA